MSRLQNWSQRKTNQIWLTYTNGYFLTWLHKLLPFVRKKKNITGLITTSPLPCWFLSVQPTFSQKLLVILGSQSAVITGVEMCPPCHPWRLPGYNFFPRINRRSSRQILFPPNQFLRYTHLIFSPMCIFLQLDIVMACKASGKSSHHIIIWRAIKVCCSWFCLRSLVSHTFLRRLLQERCVKAK